MKSNSLLLIASLAALISTASAASNQSDTAVLILPNYVVTAPRYDSAEQQVKARLEEFRRQSLTPMAIVPELSLLNHRTTPAVKVANTGREGATASGAKS